MKLPKDIKQKIESDLDGIYTSNRYHVMNGRKINDGKFQAILEVIGEYFESYFKEGYRLAKAEDDLT